MFNVGMSSDVLTEDRSQELAETSQINGSYQVTENSPESKSRHTRSQEGEQGTTFGRQWFNRCLILRLHPSAGRGHVWTLQ